MKSSARCATVGIVVPCYNQGVYVGECIESVYQQSYRNWRLVLVDDASSDSKSASICGSVLHPQVTVELRKTNLGRALIRNCGVDLLGEVDYVLMLDCDDQLAPDYIEKLVLALERDSDVGLAYGTLHWFGDAPASVVGKTWPTDDEVSGVSYVVNNVPGPGVMFRRNALKDTRGWRADFTECSGEDHDIWLQVWHAGWKLAWVRDAAYMYRQHAASFLATAKASQTSDRQLAILKNHLDRIGLTIGVNEYLRLTVVPTLLTQLREARFREAGNLFARTSSITGFSVVLRLLLLHYGRRISFLLRRRQN